MVPAAAGPNTERVWARVADLRSRLVVMPQLMTSDGLALYASAILTNFGPAAPYAQTVKNYSRGARRSPDCRYEPPRMGTGSFITKRAVLGTPNLADASTSRAEVKTTSWRATRTDACAACACVLQDAPRAPDRRVAVLRPLQLLPRAPDTRVTPALAAA